MFPVEYELGIQKRSFLHACGGVSSALSAIIRITEFSPRMWRCFYMANPYAYLCEVFSTHVEVFLILTLGLIAVLSFLHACGGVSSMSLMDIKSVSFSPRMWRCFFPRRMRHSASKVFSTHVEVFLTSDKVSASSASFLHACGGVSWDGRHHGRFREFSPRMWRCFSPSVASCRRGLVFSTHVEVFLKTPRWLST